MAFICIEEFDNLRASAPRFSLHYLRESIHIEIITHLHNVRIQWIWKGTRLDKAYLTVITNTSLKRVIDKSLHILDFS